MSAAPAKSAPKATPSPAAAPRLRIYALVGGRPALRPDSGDQINEARFLTALSAFADVYYNGQLFRPGAPGWGLDATEVAPVAGGYDLYYVRNNPAVFGTCPGPKVGMAYPYDAGVFYSADALFTTTEAWKSGLENFGAPGPVGEGLRRWYGELKSPTPRLINIGQTIDPAFTVEPARRDVTEARARMTFGKAIGFFGRIEDNTFPMILAEAFLNARDAVPELQFVAAGTPRMTLAPEMLLLPRIDHADMPAYVRACVATASDEGPDSLFLGSGKVLDAMAAGTPVLAYRTPAREEQLGDDYPLYYTDRRSCLRRIMEVVFDGDVRAEAKRVLAERRALFMPDARAAALEAQIRALLPAAS